MYCFAVTPLHHFWPQVPTSSFRKYRQTIHWIWDPEYADEIQTEIEESGENH